MSTPGISVGPCWFMNQMQTAVIPVATTPPPTYSQGILRLGFGGGATACFFSIAGAVKIGTMHSGLQHLTSLPAALGAMNPFVSHIGHLTSRVLPGACW